MLSPWLLEWLKALGLPLLAVAVSIASIFPARRQAQIAAEKLRHDLYDRRFAIYMAFHEMLVMLVAIIEKQDADTELRKANAARAHSPFLLDEQLGTYLEQLHKEAFRVNATGPLVRAEMFGPSRNARTKPFNSVQIGSLSSIGFQSYRGNSSVS